MSNQSKQEKAVLNGEAVAGPMEKAGTDTVKADLSFHNLGEKRAKELSRSDDLRQTGTNTIREDLIQIIGNPQPSWDSYATGFKVVLDQRKEAGKPTMALSVLLSNVRRILKAAKTDSVGVTAKLADSALRFNVLVKSLPKVQKNMGEKHEKTAEQTAIEVETNVGALVQVIQAAAKRLETLGKGHTPHPAYFAYYMGKELQEFYAVAQDFCLKTISEHTVAGIIQHEPLMLALSLAPKPAAQAAGEMAVAA